jgi:hypothetical protein
VFENWAGRELSVLIHKSGAAAQRDEIEMRLFFYLASFSIRCVVPTIVADRRLARQKKGSHHVSSNFSNTP